MLNQIQKISYSRCHGRWE